MSRGQASCKGKGTSLTLTALYLPLLSAGAAQFCKQVVEQLLIRRGILIANCTWNSGSSGISNAVDVRPPKGIQVLDGNPPTLPAHDRVQRFSDRHTPEQSPLPIPPRCLLAWLPFALAKVILNGTLWQGMPLDLVPLGVPSHPSSWAKAKGTPAKGHSGRGSLNR